SPSSFPVPRPATATLFPSTTLFRSAPGIPRAAQPAGGRPAGQAGAPAGGSTHRFQRFRDSRRLRGRIRPRLERTRAQPALRGGAAPRGLRGSVKELESPPRHDVIAVLDFGGQYAHLIARRVREARVYCEVFPPGVPAAELGRRGVRGVILSGGPRSVYEPDA